ncbi:UvrB/UvrC protein [Syntrophobotulus glycolicus DSM 8271]|uniref:UvrB/UvrC protein n=1 Tax=Syntrophobotulus glycolicus (strain DSM 8271 / FlGlyR) TaxID=645991 RepID=F0SWX1_SYNGF|nr:UvrB/UvrC motif-containing protein [Syntrophobotulus glycolicus]ADY54661.1 UvrB/UvrC protein [Syntrophobotulus glycolicus DSM 8271]
MICENCHVREAKVHFTKIANGQTGVMHLCQKCAQKIQGFGFGIYPGMVSDFLQALFEAESNKQFVQSENKETEKCPLCGMTLSKIQQHGKIGCSECYNQFEPQLEVLLRKIHGGGFHVGRVPAHGRPELQSRNELQQLRKKLQEAVHSEEFEEAAVLRDRIKELEKTAGGEQDGK